MPKLPSLQNPMTCPGSPERVRSDTGHFPPLSSSRDWANYGYALWLLFYKYHLTAGWLRLGPKLFFGFAFWREKGSTAKPNNHQHRKRKRQPLLAVGAPRVPRYKNGNCEALCYKGGIFVGLDCLWMAIKLYFKHVFTLDLGVQFVAGFMAP